MDGLEFESLSEDSQQKELDYQASRVVFVRDMSNM